MCNKIAVYGTLRYGGPANRLMLGAKRIGRDRIKGKLYRVGWFPGVKLTPNDEDLEVIVDVYELPEKEPNKFLEQIDLYEGFRDGRPEESLFVREKVLLKNMNEEVFVYVYKEDVSPEDLIANGDWLDQ